MVSIASCELIVLVVLIYSSNIVRSSLHSVLIHRRQLLDGTAKSGGVAPKPRDGDSSVGLFSSARPPLLSTSDFVHEKLDQRSVKETAQPKSSSKAGLIAAIAAPTGILGIVGAAVGAFLFKKNQSNSATDNIGGIISRFFGANANATMQNKSGENHS